MNTTMPDPNDPSTSVRVCATVVGNSDAIASQRASRLKAVLRWMAENVAVTGEALKTFSGF
jgi:hypothetical protein